MSHYFQSRSVCAGDRDDQELTSFFFEQFAKSSSTLVERSAQNLYKQASMPRDIQGRAMYGTEEQLLEKELWAIRRQVTSIPRAVHLIVRYLIFRQIQSVSNDIGSKIFPKRQLPGKFSFYL